MRWGFLCFALLPAVASGAQLTFSGCGPAQRVMLRSDGEASCTCVHRALYAMQRYGSEIGAYFGTGLNFGVFVRNPEFYLRRLSNRYAACTRASVPTKCVGVCGTTQGTQAYVKVTFGFVGRTIHFCDEYFRNPPPSRVEIFTHELGRLEGIGDAPGLETDNIYVWDNIIRPLCDPRVLAELEQRHRR